MMILYTLLAGGMSSRVFTELSIENPHPVHHHKPRINPVSKLSSKICRAEKKLINNGNNMKKSGPIFETQIYKDQFSKFGFNFPHP